jgi:hypothetical protein
MRSSINSSINLCLDKSAIAGGEEALSSSKEENMTKRKETIYLISYIVFVIF